MLFKAFVIAVKVAVATTTGSEKIADEVQAFIEAAGQAIVEKIGNTNQEDSKILSASINDVVQTSSTLPPEAKKSIDDFLKKKSPPLPIIATYVFDSEDEQLRSSEIVKRVVERYGKNTSSVLPSDYSGTKYCLIPTLEKIDRGLYQLSPAGKAAWVTRNL